MGSILNCTKSQSLRKESESKGGESFDKVDKAIFNAKLARDKVKIYIKRMEEQAKKQKQLAKDQLKSNNREKAKIHLSRSKAYDTQIEVGFGQLNLLEQQIMQIDQAKNEASAIKALEQGNTLLKELQSEISIEKWENISDDMEEARQNKREIDNFLQRHNIVQEEFEEAIEGEIEKLLAEESKQIEQKFPELKPKQQLSEVNKEEENGENGVEREERVRELA